jgi:transcriptional regulator with XRE-family HTH domain
MIIAPPINPIRSYRRAHRLTQVALAKQAGVTPQIILRVEQGLFTTIPVNLLTAVAKGRTGEDILLQNYRDFVKSLRQAQTIPTSLLSEQNGIPLLTYRNLRAYYKSTTGVAKFLVLQISLLQEYEKSLGHRNIGAIRTALSDIGFKGIFVYA